MGLSCNERPTIKGIKKDVDLRHCSEKLFFKILFLIAFFLALLVYLPAPARSAERIIEGTVIRVSDGDTIQVMIKNQTKLKIRLAGIDCPEIPKINHKTGKINKPGQPYGEEATDFVKRLVLGKHIKLVTYGPDRYKRVLAFVFVDGLNINLEIVKAGLAEVYRGGGTIRAHREDLEAAEREARAAKRGVWAQGEKYESPADFRRRMRIRGN